MDKKKNKGLIIGVVVLILAVAGFVWFKNRGGLATTSSGGVFSSIEDAIAKSLSLKCEYKMGDSTTIAYVKGDKIAIEGSWQGKNDSAVIMKDNKIWSWDKTTKEGVIFPINVDEEGEEEMTSSDIVGDLEAQKNYCKVAVYSETVFDPPTDVVFQDLESLMQGIPAIEE